MPFDPNSLVPLLGGMNPNGGSAFMRGFARAQQEIQQRKQLEQQTQRQTMLDERMTRRDEQDAALEARIASTQEAQETRAQQQHLLGQGQEVEKYLNDPSVLSEEDLLNRATFMRNLAPRMGVDPGFVEMQTNRVLATLPRKRKLALYDRVTKGLRPEELAQLRAETKTFRPEGASRGEEFTFAQLEEDVRGLPGGMQFQPPTSQQPNTPEEQYYHRFAAENGAASFLELPTAKQAEARKAWMQSDDRPTQGSDPEIAELRKDLLRLQVERAGEEKEPNQSQFTAAGYAGRMEQAETIIGALAPKVAGMNWALFEAQTKLPSAAQSATMQSYRQAARNFINSVLRRESGAVISPSEFAEARQQYLPQPGDTAETKAQKAANRLQVIGTMKRASGSAYEPPVTPVGGRSSGPQIGERRSFGGQVGEWDGTGWKPVGQ